MDEHRAGREQDRARVDRRPRQRHEHRPAHPGDGQQPRDQPGGAGGEPSGAGEAPPASTSTPRRAPECPRPWPLPAMRARRHASPGGGMIPSCVPPIHVGIPKSALGPQGPGVLRTGRRNESEGARCAEIRPKRTRSPATFGTASAHGDRSARVGATQPDRLGRRPPRPARSQRTLRVRERMRALAGRCGRRAEVGSHRRTSDQAEAQDREQQHPGQGRAWPECANATDKCEHSVVSPRQLRMEALFTAMKIGDLLQSSPCAGQFILTALGASARSRDRGCPSSPLIRRPPHHPTVEEVHPAACEPGRRGWLAGNASAATACTESTSPCCCAPALNRGRAAPPLAALASKRRVQE